MTIFTIQTSCDEPLFISIGGFCVSAIQLKKQNLRHAAYPFDWLITPFDALYKCLDEDFEHFLEDIHINDNQNGISDFYGLEFVHDWPRLATNALEIDSDTIYVLLPSIKEKYVRRINRFRKACLGNQKIFFVRWYYWRDNADMFKMETIRLRDLIAKKYKKLDFEIIAVAFDDIPWHVEKIRKFDGSISDKVDFTCII